MIYFHLLHIAENNNSLVFLKMCLRMLRKLFSFVEFFLAKRAFLFQSQAIQRLFETNLNQILTPVA